MAKKGLFSILVILLVLGLISIPGTVRADESEGKPRLVSPIGLEATLGPLNPEYLSGGAWLALTGQDPSLRLEIRVDGDKDIKNSPPETSLQAAGGAAAALIPYRSPAAKFSRTILLSRDLGRLPYQTEPHIAVNPKDPDHIVAALIDYNFPGVANYVSIDGGATWDGPYQPKIPRGQYTGAGDPVVAFDREGNAYVSQLTISIEEFTVGGIWGYTYVLSVVTSKSSDGGFTWQETVVASPGEVMTYDYPTTEGERPRGEVGLFFIDKPWLVAAPNPNNPDQDILYLTYTLFVEILSLSWADELPFLMIVEELATIELVRSEDGGKTWSYPVQVSPVVSVNPQPGIKGQLVHGSQPVVAPDGSLYVAWFYSTTDGPWEGEGEIWVAASRDRGQTFYQRQLAASFLELDLYPRNANFRLWGTGFPQTAVGANGELYIAYSAYSRDNLTDGGDIFMVSSVNGGRTWTSPVRVNDDDTSRLQFFPSITTDPKGNLHMMWGDTRDDPTELAYHIYYSTSEDKGKTWEFNSRVSDFPSNPNFAFPYGAFIGDYFSVKATSEDVYMVWADSRLGEVTGSNQKIAFARKTLMPTPSIFLSPPSGSAGRDITVQGHNFQPETDIFIDVGGVLTATARTTEDGTFSMTIFAPISGEGPRDVVVRDISGNIALASFFTEFGFDTFEQGIGALEERLDEISQQITTLATTEPATPEEAFPWLVAVLAGALGLALAALGVVLYRTRARG